MRVTRFPLRAFLKNKTGLITSARESLWETLRSSERCYFALKRIKASINGRRWGWQTSKMACHLACIEDHDMAGRSKESAEPAHILKEHLITCSRLPDWKLLTGSQKMTLWSSVCFLGWTTFEHSTNLHRASELKSFWAMGHLAVKPEHELRSGGRCRPLPAAMSRFGFG